MRVWVVLQTYALHLQPLSWFMGFDVASPLYVWLEA
jgi:hypothetical protein